MASLGDVARQRCGGEPVGSAIRNTWGGWKILHRKSRITGRKIARAASNMADSKVNFSRRLTTMLRRTVAGGRWGAYEIDLRWLWNSESKKSTL